ncbi:hypothetical protein AK88_00171 [Plasmodium fragile]|uniref:Schizont-infected cell agglutination C-terminal domain-containing protein n=1 Tax=Plasmodium fragile TaxID=5857 RepID=A0A0D9QT23_PLAFR|nr:uncharacterized protein AK88_00171 [Plasmodium fragile]KJP90002.1 hypothetical protein AK88_00171 [Plasmodium fragile]
MLQEVDDIFHELLSRIGQRSGNISGFRGDLYNKDGACISRCREIVNLMLYMKGYHYNQGTGTWDKKTIPHGTTRTFKEYLECILGSEVLLRLYARNTHHQGLITEVSDKLGQSNNLFGQKFEPGLCENIDFGNILFQSKSIGTGIKNRLEQLSQQWAPTHVGRGYTASGTCGWDDADDADEDGKPQRDEECNENAGVITEDDALMKEIKGWVPIGPFPHVKKVLEDMQKNGVSKEKCELEQKIRNGVKTVKDRVNPPKKSQPPEKPAGANGNPRGPVQTVGATPVSPPGSGTPTSPSGGGGGKAGGADGGKGQGKAGEAEACPWQSILEGKSRHVHVLKHYDSAELERLKTVLQQFTDYMEEKKDMMDAYGENCHNSGWDDFGDAHQYKGQTVADVVRCRVMSTALFFANKQGKNGDSEHGQKTHDDELYEKLRCEVAHVFGYMLKHQYCKTQGWKRGVEYAWKTVKTMGQGGPHGTGAIPGPVMDGTCTQCGYAGRKTQLGLINGHIAEWFVDQGIMGDIAKIEQQMPCDQDWRAYKQSQGVTDTDQDISNQLPHVKKTEDEIRTKTKTAFDEVTKIVDQKIQEKHDAATAGKDKNNKNTKNTHNPNTFSTTTPTTDAPPKTVVSGDEKTTDNGKKQTDGASNTTQPSTTPPPPPPPPSASPAAPPAAGSTGATRATGESGAQEPTEQSGEEKCKDNLRHSAPRSRSIVITATCTSDAALGGGNHVPDARAHGSTTPVDEADKNAQSEDQTQRPQHVGSSTPAGATDHKDSTTGETTVTTPAEEVVPQSPSSIGGTAGDSASPEVKTTGYPSPTSPPPGGNKDASTTQSTDTGGQQSTPPTPSSRDQVVDGGNDDPPPLNPPKPKPNPNPDQSGSSGDDGGADQSSGGGAHGVSGGEGKGGEDGQKDGGAGGAVGGGTGGSSGVNGGVSGGGTGRGAGAAVGGAGGSPPSGGPSKGANDQPLPTPPPPSKPFNPKDLIPYTPAIIPAVVGIGIIAFFLWKYFAYLGTNRRRTYRTVRDVPSPPLDEEILAHLQRGDLPPPDYGYTMVRDTPPSSAAERRGQRPPRVHTRTIIELHLEVLNECEAAEWENVRDDYWKIVVEQFARDLQQDTDTNNNILGVSTSDYGSPGSNVPSTADPSTDFDGTDPCSPHDCDPCSGMATMQLATDRSAPNEEDPDPWSCMETIQLETDPCPPNEQDPDPWSCMESIQLETDPFPPNADNHDPWRCMENIQLDAAQRPATGPGHVTSECTQCIPWIEQHKHIVRACTTQPWFNALKSEWKQYYQQHATDAASSEHRTAATMESKKLDLWKQWVAQQHQQLSTYSEQEWFQHLLNNVEEETVPQKAEVPREEQHLEVETVMAAEDLLRVRDLPRSQPLHQPPHMTKPLNANIWILILALIIEQCELECTIQDRDLYVDTFLEHL